MRPRGCSLFASVLAYNPLRSGKNRSEMHSVHVRGDITMGMTLGIVGLLMWVSHAIQCTSQAGQKVQTIVCTIEPNELSPSLIHGSMHSPVLSAQGDHPDGSGVCGHCRVGSSQQRRGLDDFWLTSVYGCDCTRRAVFH